MEYYEAAEKPSHSRIVGKVASEQRVFGGRFPNPGLPSHSKWVTRPVRVSQKGFLSTLLAHLPLSTAQLTPLDGAPSLVIVASRPRHVQLPLGTHETLIRVIPTGTNDKATAGALERQRPCILGVAG